MTLIRVKPTVVPTLHRMHLLAMKKIFDPVFFTATEDIELEHGIENWVRKVGLTWDDKAELRRIINALIANEQGHFNKEKDVMKVTGVDYRKVYAAGLPYIDVDTSLPENSNPGQPRIIIPQAS